MFWHQTVLALKCPAPKCPAPNRRRRNVPDPNNTVMDGSMILSVCPFAIETTFPLSNFKTKHIFGILMTLWKFIKLWAPQAPETWGAVGAPIFFFSSTTAESGGKWAPEAP